MDLSDYDILLVNSSGGKDSQTCLGVVSDMASEAGLEERVVVVHADLGRVEWQGTRDLAELQAAHYGHRFEVVQRSQNDLLGHVRARGKWPSAAARYCTSDHKRGPVRTLMTRLSNEFHGNRRGQVRRPCRLLNIMGMRAQESASRAKRLPFRHDASASNGRRQVDEWLPIHEWTEGEVWEDIARRDVPHHRAYDAGMGRLSCCFCVLANRDDLMIAGHENPALLNTYVELEREIGHDFRMKLPILSIKQALERGERGVPNAQRHVDGGGHPPAGEASRTHQHCDLATTAHHSS